MIDKEPSSSMQQIITLRYVIGFLGEKLQFNWWPTAFYGTSSRLFLEPVFSKTATLAQYHGVVEAGRRIHDEHLNVGSYHLFRLSEEIEQNLHAIVQAKLGELFDSDLTSSSEAALGALGALGKAEAGGSEPFEGPILVGEIGNLLSDAVLGKLANIYRTAFSTNTKIFPYFAC
jgi:hypothetical protein